MIAVYDAVIDVLATRFGIDNHVLSPETHFKEVGFDSLAWLEMATALEKRFGVSIEDAEMVLLARVSDVVALLKQKGVYVSQ